MSTKVTLDWFGDVSEEPSYFVRRAETLADPDSKILSFPDWENEVIADLNATIAYQALKLVTKFRPTFGIRESESVETRVPLDDLYLDVNLFERLFVTLGLKNYREGFALSFNPTDFLAENKDQDFTRRDEERKADREGNVVAAFDLLLENFTLTGIYAPRLEPLQDEQTRALFKVSALVEAAKLDASLSYFHAHRPGVGLNLSKSVGDQLIVHTEVSGRWGSPRKQVRKTQDAIDNLRPALFEIRDLPDRDTLFLELVTGGSYTFGNGMSVIGEYYFIQDGYSDQQWDRVLELIELSRSSLLDGLFANLSRRNLLQANRLLTFRRLREHYVFVRFHHPGLFNNFDSTLSVLLNAQDRSVAIAPILDFIGVKNMRLGINATILQGTDDSEFGLSPFGAILTLRLRYLF